MIKALIVEDEEALRRLIANFIKDIDPEIIIVGECENILEAEVAIKKYSPDIIFLDVVMPRGTGLDLLEKIPDINSEIIFITAYDKYVLDAFQFSATGYVLKPIDKTKLKTAIDNAKKRVVEKSSNKISQLLQYLDKKNDDTKIGIPTQEGVILVDSKKIIRLEGCNSYTRIFFEDGSFIMSSYNLSKFDNVLPESLFFKIHKSHIISIDKVVMYMSKDNCIEMMNGDMIPVSKRLKGEFLSLFKIAKR